MIVNLGLLISKSLDCGLGVVHDESGWGGEGDDDDGDGRGPGGQVYSVAGERVRRVAASEPERHLALW